MAATATLALIAILGQVPAAKAKPATRVMVTQADRLAIVERERTDLTALVKRLDEKGQSDHADAVRLLIEPKLEPGVIRFRPLPEYAPPAKEPEIPAEAAKVRGAAAKALFELAGRAAAKPTRRLALADECLRGVIARDPNHAEARRLLGFIKAKKGGWATPHAASLLDRGHVLHPKFGWVLATWVPNLDAGKLPISFDAHGKAVKWAPAEDADEQHATWPDAWDIDTAPHFSIKADVPLSEAVAFAGRLEAFHDLFLSLFADVIGSENHPLARRFDHPDQKPTASSKKFLVAYFSSKTEYMDHLRKTFGMNEDQSLGYYMPPSLAKRANTQPRSYFYKDDGNPIAAHATLYHEASHQILFESAGKTSYDDNKSNYWIWEGLGTYFETVTPQDDGTLLVGGIVGPRLAQATQQLALDEHYVPLAKFTAMDEHEFREGQTIVRNYAQAMALAVFLLNGEGGRYRDAFLDYVAASYRGAYRARATKPPTLADRLGVPFETLDKQFREYFK